MIISVSRRTDIPACHFDWFLSHLQNGYVEVPNPRNARMVRKVDLTPAAVDAFVFWTKNPLPMEAAVTAPDSLLNQYAYYFQFTLTPYGRDVEPGLPEKTDLVDVFRRFSRILGAHRMIWRYDPILISPIHDVPYHLAAFREYAAQLSGYAETCVFSFLDEYRCMRKAMITIGGRPPIAEEEYLLARGMAETARDYGFRLFTCAEKADFSQLGIEHGACIDGTLVSRIVEEHKEKTGRNMPVSGAQISMFPEAVPNFSRAKGLRGACMCAESIDLGEYGTCTNGCLYCYGGSG